MTKFNARSFAKFGFVRDESKDFSDDGARFRCWMYNGVRVSYTTCCGEVFISPSFSTYKKNFTYEDFRNAMDNLGLEPDCYNGIENDRDFIDLCYLAEQIDATLKLIDELEEKFSKPEPIAEAARSRKAFEEGMLAAAMRTIEKVDWLHFDGNGTRYKVENLRTWYRDFERRMEKLQAIDLDDAHKVNSKFYKYGYLEVREGDFYLRELSKVLGK